MKIMVLKIEIKDEKTKKKILKTIAGVQGVDSVDVDMKEKKLTVIGDTKPVVITNNLRNFGVVELLSVGPARKVKVGSAREVKVGSAREVKVGSAKDHRGSSTDYF